MDQAEFRSTPLVIFSLLPSFLCPSASPFLPNFCYLHFFSISFICCPFDLISLFVVFWGSERRSHYIAQDGLKLSILLPQHPECWDYRQAPPHSDLCIIFNVYSMDYTIHT